MNSNIFAFIILAAALSVAMPLSAQTADGSAKTPAKKTAPAEKPKMDLDGFFKDAEKQTREEYEKGGNCLPKPKDYSPKEPVT